MKLCTYSVKGEFRRQGRLRGLGISVEIIRDAFSLVELNQ